MPPIRLNKVPEIPGRDIDRVLQSTIGDVPGVVVLAMTLAGTILKAFALRDLFSEVEMTLDTLIWPAFMTKALAAAGLCNCFGCGSFQASCRLDA